MLGPMSRDHYLRRARNSVVNSSLRLSRQWNRRFWAMTWVLASTFIALDVMQPPREQYTAAMYLGVIGLYQEVGRPYLKGWIQCRYHPTCSEYSAKAVRVHGIAKGGILTVQRLLRCFPDVPVGTEDSVPLTGCRKRSAHGFEFGALLYDKGIGAYDARSDSMAFGKETRSIIVPHE